MTLSGVGGDVVEGDIVLDGDNTLPVDPPLARLLAEYRDGLDTETRRRISVQVAESFQALMDEFGGHHHVMPDVGPTTACWTCDAIVRIQDSYSPKKDGRPFGDRQSLCEDCFKALEAKGVAHENLLR